MQAVLPCQSEALFHHACSCGISMPTKKILVSVMGSMARTLIAHSEEEVLGSSRGGVPKLYDTRVDTETRTQYIRFL